MLKYTKLIVYGQALGGAVAIDLIAKNEEKIDVLILENTFLNIVSYYNSFSTWFIYLLFFLN